MTSTDATITQARRHLETLQLPVPRPEVLAEIVRVAIADAATIGAAAARGYTQGHEQGYKDGWDDGHASGLNADAFDMGYKEAQDDIKELAANTGVDNPTGPTAA